MTATGFLVPPWYRSEEPSDMNMNVCSIIWGASLCCAVFTCAKAARQTWIIWTKKKRKGLNLYVGLVWAEWVASVVISIISWLFLKGIVIPSFWLFFAILCLWVVQMQCILQIIINRVGLMLPNKERVRKIKIAVFVIIAMINISVFCIWIPARLQISERYVRINDIWDRTEKALFALVDGTLNAYFIWVVRTKLINNGLVKYQPLFRYNVSMVCVSLLLDVLLIGSMSLPSGVIYIQFHPLVYLMKLHIELNLAELIAKVVRATNPLHIADIGSTTDYGCSQGQHQRNTTGISKEASSLDAQQQSKPVMRDIGELDLGGIRLSDHGGLLLQDSAEPALSGYSTRRGTESDVVRSNTGGSTLPLRDADAAV